LKQLQRIFKELSLDFCANKEPPTEKTKQMQIEEHSLTGKTEVK